MFRAQSVATALLNDPGDRNSGPRAVERGATGARARGARLAACEMRVAGGTRYGCASQVQPPRPRADRTPPARVALAQASVEHGVAGRGVGAALAVGPVQHERCARRERCDGAVEQG